MREESGFSILEVVIVVVVVAVLLLVTIPTFIGASERARDAEARSHVRNALGAAVAHYAEEGAFTADTATLESLEPALDWSEMDASIGGVVATVASVSVGGDDRDGQMVCLASRSTTGRDFLLVRIATGPDAGTYYGVDATMPRRHLGRRRVVDGRLVAACHVPAGDPASFLADPVARWCTPVAVAVSRSRHLNSRASARNVRRRSPTRDASGRGGDQAAGEAGAQTRDASPLSERAGPRRAKRVSGSLLSRMRARSSASRSSLRSDHSGCRARLRISWGSASRS